MFDPRALLLGLPLVLALVPSSCRDPVTVAAGLAARQTLTEAIDGFRQTAKTYDPTVAEAVKATKQQLIASVVATVDLPAIAVDWEKRWQHVQDQTGELETRFETVTTASEDFWTVLDAVIDDIKEPALRAAEQTRSTAARAQWDAAARRAREQIGKARALRDRGNDLGRAMLAAAMRRNLAEYTETLNSIAVEAELLGRALEALTEEGMAIVTATTPAIAGGA